MKLITYRTAEGEAVGLMSVDETTVYPVKELGCSAENMIELIEQSTPESLAAMKAKTSGCKGIPFANVELCAPIPHPRHDITCIGENYLEHALEYAKYKGTVYVKPDYPVYFSKRVNRAVAHNGFILSHSDITERLDYEAELAVIIGRECSHVSREEAFDYVFGYTVGNDVSAREIQSRHVQFTMGKGLDNFAAMGPWIVTVDEFKNPPILKIGTKVNGEVRQDSCTDQFIFDIPHLISELSSGITLYPGDIIMTGTPSGVAMGMHPPKWLHSGDVVECEIEGIGVLRNTVL